MRVSVRSASASAVLILGETVVGNNTGGFKWCVDHAHAIVYAKMIGSQPPTPPYKRAAFEVRFAGDIQKSCQFLATHWTYGNTVRVHNQEHLNCSVAYSPTQLPGKDGVTNVNITVS